MPKNTFYGAVLHYSDVNNYYPINWKNPDFDHFVFQQVLANPNDADNTYTLCAYAVFTDVSQLLPVLITLGPQNKTGKPYKAPAGVQFANMKLEQGDLSQLYPQPPLPPTTADTTLTPYGPYGTTEYVTYKASTDGDGKADTGGTVIINPSPPH